MKGWTYLHVTQGCGGGGRNSGVCVCVWGGGGQAYSHLSTTWCHITVCKLDSVVHAYVAVGAWWVNLDLSCLGRTVYARQFLGAKKQIHFCHRWPEINHSDCYTDSKPAIQSPNSLMPIKCQAEKHKSPSIYVFGVMQFGIEPCSATGALPLQVFITIL